MLAAGALLLEAAREVQAYGLAAAHLGLDEPLVVISFAADTGKRDYRVLYNPEIVALSDQTETGPEGSVSRLGMEVPVKRAIWADVAWSDAFDQRQTARFKGFVARIAQHEIDQVNGIFFLRRVSLLKRNAALRRLQKSHSLP
jgi:peptide deformylase